MASTAANNNSNNQQQASDGRGGEPKEDQNPSGQSAETRGDGGDATGGSASTASSRSSTSSVKSIYIYRNGDKFSPAKKIVLNPRQLRDWDVFLEQTTQAVNPIKGAVRTIVTPRRGRQRLNDFETFEDKGHYVALSNGEKFKPMPYVPEDDATANQGQHEVGGAGESPGVSPRRNISNNRVVLEPIRPVVHNKKLMAIQPRFNTQSDVNSIHAKTIRIYRNGDEFTPAILNLLKPSEQVSMEAVLKAIEDRVVLPSNRAIRKLYDMSGKRIWDPKNIDHEKYYVAAGHEPFLARPYGQKLPVLIVGRTDHKSTIKYLAQPITPAKESSRRPKDSQHKPANRISKAQKEKAASQIQASIRGFQTRKEAAEKQADKPITIQSDTANSKTTAPPRQQQQQKQKTSQQDKPQQQQPEQKQKQPQEQQKQQQQPEQKQKQPQEQQKQQQQPEQKQKQPQEQQKQQQQQEQKQQQSQQEQQQKKQPQQRQDQNQQQQQANSQPTPEEQDKAATVIQNSVRGFETRKEVAEKIANKPIEITPDDANSKTAAQPTQQKTEQQKQKPQHQEQGQQKKEKQTEEKQEQQEPEEQKQQPTPQDLDKAATTIQAAYKGYTARQAAADNMAGKQDSQKQQQQQQQQPPQEDKQDPQPQKQLTAEEENAANNIAAAVNSYKTRKDAANKEAASSQQQQKQQQQQQQEQQQEQHKADEQPKNN